MRHWQKILSDETVTLKTILFNNEFAGSIVRYMLEGNPEVGYWVGKKYWGRGIATQALSEFLKLIHERPLFAHVAKDNFASIRVLEKCGFEMIGEGKEFSNARGEEVEEYIYKLSSIPVFPDEISEWAFD
jgi:RimJ/RimL family protein N-acetyltransferase